MADVFCRVLCFISFYSFLILFNFNLSDISSTQRHRIIFGGYLSISGVYCTNSQLSLIRISIRARRVGFHRTKLSLTKWTRRGQTSLVVAGHDPPLDITIFMDISPNPGPMDLAMNFQNGCGLTQGRNLHIIAAHAFFRDQPLLSQPIASLVSLRAVTNRHHRSMAVESRTLI